MPPDGTCPGPGPTDGVTPPGTGGGDGESTSNPHRLATTGSPAGPLSIAGAALLLAGILLLLVLRKRRVGDES
ncbi:LPXTG cell wall anchor domain-containing protein [Saccharopolyspora shandongensis]|uniref:LPXTG cell wall anchor domain-containing protein n=1 Tax=Saccharopolyspora shandongensis TaxID=418495 RepID=UPI00343041BB